MPAAGLPASTAIGVAYDYQTTAVGASYPGTSRL